MGLTREINLDLERRYIEITDLIHEICEDPESEKAARQKARIKSLKIIGVITVLIKRASPDCLLRLNGMLAAAHFLSANACYLNCLNEKESGQKHLMECLMIIEKFGEQSYLMLLKHIVLNMIGEMLRVRDHEEALSYLDKAENVYRKWRKYVPIKVDDMFLPTTKNLAIANMNLFEKIYSQTMYIKATIHLFNLDDELKWAILSHKGLESELKCVRYNMLTWTIRAILISKSFIKYFGFKQARHVLAAAQYVLEMYECYNSCNQDEKAVFSDTRAKLYETWALYGTQLLSLPAEMASSGNDERTTDLGKLDLKATSVTREEIESLIFVKLGIVKYEDQITDEEVVTLPDALRVYKNIHKWLDEALLFYSDPLSDSYLRIMHNRSIAYLSLTLYEKNSKIQTMLHQKRIDVFEKLSSTIDHLPNDIRKGIWQELARSYYDFVSVEYVIYKDLPTIASANTINSYLNRSTGALQNFLNMSKNPETNEFPERFEVVSEEIDFLEAHVTLALSYQKFIDPTEQELLRNNRESKKLLEVVVDYCERNTDAQRHLNVDYVQDRIREMYLRKFNSSRKLPIPSL